MFYFFICLFHLTVDHQIVRPGSRLLLNNFVNYRRLHNVLENLWTGTFNEEKTFFNVIEKRVMRVYVSGERRHRSLGDTFSCSL